MKKLSVLLLSFAMTLCIAAPAFAADAAAQMKTLSVSGSATIDSAPDIANITVQVITSDMEPSVSQSGNAQKSNAVIDQLKEMGIDESDIKTVYYRIRPVYSSQTVESSTGSGDKITTDQSQLTGYETTHSIGVTLRDIDSTGKVIDIAIANGANATNNISFGLSTEKRASVYLDALSQAAKDAQTKANVLANALGLENLSIQSVTASDYSPYYGGGYGYAGADSYAMNSVAPDMAPGNVSVTASVNVVYTY